MFLTETEISALLIFLMGIDSLEGRTQRPEQCSLAVPEYATAPGVPLSPKTVPITSAARCFDMFPITLRKWWNRWWEGLSDMIEAKKKRVLKHSPFHLLGDILSALWSAFSQEFKLSRRRSRGMLCLLGSKSLKSQPLGYLACPRILEWVCLP